MSFFKRSCEVNGHKFEARYDKIPMPMPNVKLTDQDPSCLKFLTDRYHIIYVHDICIYCGQTIPKPKSN